MSVKAAAPCRPLEKAPGAAVPGQLGNLLQQVLHICSPVRSRRPARQPEIQNLGHVV